MYRSPLVPGLVAVVLIGGCAPDYKLDRTAARIVVSPGLLDLGSAAVGSRHAGDLTLTSVAGGAVTVVAVDVLAVEGGGFSVDGPLPVVPAEGAIALPVTFAPEEPGWHLARLSITTDEPRDNVHLVDVRASAGFASAQVWPSVLDMGPVPAGGEGTGALTLANTGDVDLTVGAGVIEGGPFTLVSTTPLALPVGDTVTLPVTFSPTDDALATGTLTFLLDGTVTLPPVTLRGNACGLGPASLYDADGDGYTACATDCDDDDPTVRPGGEEVCDGADDDCDGAIDEGTSCSDDDGDGLSEADGDCNDGDPAVSSAAAEVPGNGIDDDCDGTVDDGAEDADGDGYAAESGDCAPDDAASYPGAPERADGVDNDCDGRTDEGTSAYDDDGDGLSEDEGDCDDGDATVYAGAAETADGVDDDCDGAVDEGTRAADDDGDGWTENGGDCDDTSATTNPGAREIAGDGRDNDCDGTVE